jgi:LysR family glycine cleavage system transcriptional activator
VSDRVDADLRLPPLNALRVFEAAGRLQSIRRAAAELDVTPGAVSRHVRQLEAWLGTSLFKRSSHSITLTDDGERYLAAVGLHLRGISAATEQIVGVAAQAQLRVRTWTLFAGWLIPRLPDFRHANPNIDVQLFASSQRTDFRQADVDVEIVGHGTWLQQAGAGPEVDRGMLGDSRFTSVLAVRSDLVCVCSPAFLAAHPLARPADLVALGGRALLRSLTAPELWERWLHAAGVRGLDVGQSQLFGDSALTAAAARAGQGIAILPRTVLMDDIAAGRLVVPFAAEQAFCAFDFYLLAPPERFRRRPVRVFQEWLVQQAA